MLIFLIFFLNLKPDITSNYMMNRIIPLRYVYLISKSFFINLFHENSSAIYYENRIITMIIQESMFFNCTSIKNGGAIYFNCPEGQFGFKFICASQCYTSTSNWGQFSIVFVSEQNLIYSHYVSISKCSPINGYGNAPISFRNGNQSHYSCNSSLNFVFADSGIQCVNPNPSIISFCTFSNNKGSDRICVSMHAGIQTLQFSNILNNNSPNHGVIWTNGLASNIVQNCILINNSGILFANYEGTMTVKSCWIEHNGFNKWSGIISTTLINSITNTLKITHYSSYFCNAELSWNDSFTQNFQKSYSFIQIFFLILT